MSVLGTFLTVFGCWWIALKCYDGTRRALNARKKIEQYNFTASLMKKYLVEAEKCMNKFDNDGLRNAIDQIETIKYELVKNERFENSK